MITFVGSQLKIIANRTSTDNGTAGGFEIFDVFDFFLDFLDLPFSIDVAAAAAAAAAR
jgi:hypothetical protein